MTARCFLRLTITAMWLVGQGAPLPKNSASMEQVAFSTGLQEDVIRLGEPLLLTCVVRNSTTDTQYIPIDTPKGLLLSSTVTYMLRDASGNVFFARPWSALLATWMSEACRQVAPGDSYYWHQLLPLEHFVGPQGAFEPMAGEYALITTVHFPEFTPASEFACPGQAVILVDTLSFTLSNDSQQRQYMKQFGEVLREGLWGGFIGTPPQVMNQFRELLDAAQPLSIDTSFPYVAYVLPFALNRMKGGSPEAIEAARLFLDNYRGHVLAEEMSFDMWDFMGRLGWHGTQDSLGRVLLIDFPRNARAACLRQTKP